MTVSHRRHKGFKDAATMDANKSVKSDLTYQRYTDCDSTADGNSRFSAAVDARDDCHNSNEWNHATRDGFHRSRPQHQQQFSYQTASTSTTQQQLLDKPWSRTIADDETSVRTSITNDRSISTPERTARNSRYEPTSNMSRAGSVAVSRNGMPSVVRTRSKKLPSGPDNLCSESTCYGNTSVKSQQTSKSQSHRSAGQEQLKFPCVYCIPENRQSDCYSSVGTDTIVSSKPPLRPIGYSHGHSNQDCTPRMNNTNCTNKFTRSRGKLRQSNTSISTFTKDDETITLENSIPSALEFINENIPSTSYTSDGSTTTDQNEIKYWLDLSVKAAISVLRVNGSEIVAEKAATAVVEAGRKIKLREKKRDMQHVLRFLATKISVAVLEAGGNQRVATAVAHTIMTHDTPLVDDNSLTQSEIDRSVMLRKIDKSISQSMKRSKNVKRISDLSIDQKEVLSKKIIRSDVNSKPLPERRNESRRNPKNQHGSTSSDSAAASIEIVNEKSSLQSVERAHTAVKSSDTCPAMVDQTTNKSRSSDLTISRSNVSFEKSAQRTQQESLPVKENETNETAQTNTQRKHSINDSLATKEKVIETVARLNAHHEQEINEKMAALDAATNALLSKASNVQHYIDQQVAHKQKLDSLGYRATAVYSCDGPGFNHIDDQYRHDIRHKEKSLLEKLTNGLSEMLVCQTPTVGTQDLSANLKLPNLDCNGGVMESNYRAYGYSKKNDDTNDMISALTDDIPAHMRWQQNSRLASVTYHHRLVDYNKRMQVERDPFIDDRITPEPHTEGEYSKREDVVHNLEPPQDEDVHPEKISGTYTTEPTDIRMPAPQVDLREPNQNNLNNTPSLVNQSLYKAFDSAMNQISSQFFQEAAPHQELSQIHHPRIPPIEVNSPAKNDATAKIQSNPHDSVMDQISSQPTKDYYNEPQEVVIAGPTGTPKGNKSGIGKLKNAFSRKKMGLLKQRTVTFGSAANDLMVDNKSPKSTGQIFTGLGRRKQFDYEC